MSNRWTDIELAQQLSRNPDVRVARAPERAEPPKAKPRQKQKPTSNLEILAQTMSEATLQENIRQMANARGWLYYHTHDSQDSPEGFPDTVMLRILPGQRARLIFAENKIEGEEPTSAQEEWLSSLRQCVIGDWNVEVYLWTPRSWLSGEIEKVLA